MRQRHRVASRYHDVLGPTAVGMVSEHLAGRAELFSAGETIVALSARYQVVQADGVADAEIDHMLSDLDDLPRDFVAEGKGQRFDARATGAVVCVGMTDAGGADAHQHVAGSARRHGDDIIGNGMTRSVETDSAHKQA